MPWYIWLPLAFVSLLAIRYAYHAIPTYTYYRKAKRGDVEAQFQLALRYSFGYGIRADRSKSANWMQQAAAQGHKKALEFCNDAIGELTTNTLR